MENSKKILVTWPGYRHAVIDADPEDLLSQLQRYVRGRIEVVRSSRRWPVVLGDDLDRHLVCVVNDEGLLHMMRINEAATRITWYPGILVGPAVFLREGLNEDGGAGSAAAESRGGPEAGCHAHVGKRGRKGRATG